MTKDTLEHPKPATAYLRHALRIERGAQPKPASLKLQRRPWHTDPAKRAKEFVAIDRGRQS